MFGNKSQTVSMGDAAGSVAPGDTVICRGRPRVVRRVVVHPAGSHAYSPIRNDMRAVEVITDAGSTWAGAFVAAIGPDLRVYWDRSVMSDAGRVATASV